MLASWSAATALHRAYLIQSLAYGLHDTVKVASQEGQAGGIEQQTSLTAGL